MNLRIGSVLDCQCQPLHTYISQLDVRIDLKVFAGQLMRCNNDKCQEIFNNLWQGHMLALTNFYPITRRPCPPVCVCVCVCVFVCVGGGEGRVEATALISNINWCNTGIHQLWLLLYHTRI
jgi:hypothetical protein